MKLPTEQLVALAEAEAQKQGLDPKVVRAILLSENSGYDRGGNLVSRPAVDTETVSPAGAYGIMQVMPTTAANLQRMGYLAGTDNLSTPEGQIRAGVATIKEMNDRGVTSPTEQAVYYNGGTAALEAFRAGKNLNGETTTYLKKFTQHLGGTKMPTSPEAVPVNTNTATRESYSRSERVMDPTQRAYIAGRMSDANALSADTVAQLQVLTKGILSNTDEQKQNIDAAAAAKIQELEAKNLEKNTVQDNTESILNRFGINLNNPDSIIADRVALIRSNSTERAMLANNIGALENASPLTDPVGWMVNMVKQYPMIQRHNALIQESNAATKEIETAQRLAANQEAIQPANVKDAQNKLKLAEVNSTLATATAEKTKLVGAARAKVAQLLMDTDNVNRTNLSQNIQWAEMDSVRTNETYSNTERGKEEADFFKPINAAAATLGLDPFNKTTFKILDKETQDKWVKMAQFKRIGETPGDAIALLNATYGTTGLGKINDNTPIAGKFLQGIVQNGQQELDSMMAAATGNPKIAAQLKTLKTPMDQLAYGIDAWAKKKEDELKSKDMSRISNDNPYKLQHAYIADDPSMAGNGVAKFVKERPVGVVPTDSLILSSALADVTVKKRPVGEVAQEVAEYYRKGNDLQRRNTAATLVGFHAIDTYPVSARLATLSSNSVDLFNPISVENFLLMQAAKQKTVEALGSNATPYGI